jgi:hypothetical protein
LITIAQRASKKLCLLLYKISQVQVIGGGDNNRRLHFYNWYLWAGHGGVLDQKLTFFTEEA